VDCPDEALFFELVQGRLAEEPRQALLAHSARCPACEELLSLAMRHVESTTPAPQRDTNAPAPELAELGKRYQLLELIGSGGAGDVYKASDLQLRRLVAVKLLRSDGRPLAQRFLREAQAQARVTHENVCPVYEVGAIDGRPCIAMQFVSGKTLAVAALEMRLEERLRVMHCVVEAVQAAHALGIIHRDLKPSNVLVELGSDGSARPYVMDFGLAREIDRNGGATMTGAGIIVGTPSFMAPEQARGDVEQIDRRTDVYGLGATLYAVLLGRPPFEGVTTIELLQRVVHDEPAAPRKIQPALPVDLETIILKCLDKDPARRYPSAKALATDLDLFLRGEPIHARPLPLATRLARRVKKHRALATLAAAALVAVAALGGIVLRERLQSLARERLALRMGDEARQIESFMRIANMLPLHDTTDERAQVRARMASIATEMARAGRAGEGPGHYALGRGHLALKEYDVARADLERAWQAGWRTPECAYALGETLGRLYRRGLASLASIKSDDTRRAAQAELARTLRDPALRYLRHGAGAQLDSALLAEASIAFYERRFADASARAEQAFAAAPWLYEALWLAGDAYREQAEEKRGAADFKQTDALYEQAGTALGRALAVGRSDDELYLAECQRKDGLLRLASNQGRDDEPLYHRAVADCDNALRAHPGSTQALAELAGVHLVRSMHLCWHERDCQEVNAQARHAAEAAIAADSHDPIGYVMLGRAWRQLLDDWEMTRGLDVAPTAKQAIAALEKAVELGADWRGYTELGIVHVRLGEQTIAHGGDPRVDLDAAASNLRQATQLAPWDSRAANALGLVWFTRGLYESYHRIDPRPSMDKAMEQYRHALAMNASAGGVLNNMVNVLSERATYEAAIGEDPRPSLDHAIEYGKRAVAMNQGVVDFCDNLAGAYHERARDAMRNGRDATPDIAAAKAILATVAPNSEDGFFWLWRARVELLAARWAHQQKQPFAAELAQARVDNEHALRIGTDKSDLWGAAAEIHLATAEWGDGATVAAEIAAGLTATERAIAARAQNGEALVTRGELLMLSARREPARRAALAGEAVQALRRAFELAPVLERMNRPLLEEATREAAAK
jgi:serine/threonine-protein kinase